MCPLSSDEAWFFYRNPIKCATRKRIKDGLPKKRSTPTESVFKGWGVHIEQGPSMFGILILTAAALVVALCTTLWFIPVWRETYPDDLQGATVPFTIVFNVLGLLCQAIIPFLVSRWMTQGLI